ncbi:MAG TPA: aminotransferase class V-fold PLP-dependent enzyme [Thermoanaerobaculia bacterium]
MKWASPEFATELDREQESFLDQFPEWRETALLDDLRATEYARLDREHHVYLDYTGGGLYAASQLEEHVRLLAESVFGNPHSANPTSSAMTEHVDSARRAVLDYFDADPDEYLAVFTPNASGALKLVGESYPFGPGGRFLLTFDNHNSVNGIREFARARGAEFTYLPVHLPEMRIDRAEATRALAERRGSGPRLFAYPAQSNFSGVQHPLELIAEAHEAGWDVALDAAAFTPTNRLDLSVWKPDFVSVSFYKMFGYPTGVGCLLMRHAMLAKLRRPWFAGGTILIASVQGDGHYLAPDAAAFEDGTVNYLTLPAVEEGLRHLSGVGIDRVHQRVRCLTGWLLGAMAGLRHANGAPAIHVHGPRDLERRGGTIAFNFLDPAGRMHDIRRIQELANEVNVSLRTGCFCNPGAGEVAFGLGREEIEPFFAEETPIPFEELRARMHERFAKEIGAIRLSVGIASNFADVYRFADFARAFLDRSVEEIGRIDPIAGQVGWMRDSA